MATSLTGQNVNTTYDSLIKVGDNGPITSTPKQLSDGLGNEFPMKASSTEVIITGSLSGSATTAISASYATTASFVQNAISASYAATASFVQNAISASYAATASVAQQVSATTLGTDANYRLLFKSGAATIETAHTDAGILYNPGTNKLFVDGHISSSNDIIGFSVQGASAVAAGVSLVSLGNANIVGPITASIISASSGITGSLFGTASRAITASHALNGGVTQLLAGANISLSPASGVGQVTITSTGGGGGGFNTATGSYGSFYDTTTQTNPVANVPRSMSFNSTDISNGVSISGSTNPFNTYIKVANAGVYDIQFSAQLDKTDMGTDNVIIWLRKNGTDLAETATDVALQGNNEKEVAAWNWFVNAAAGDYFQIIWFSDDTNVRLYSQTATANHPGIPSVILTVNRVDQFLSNTGSFTGSFTGVLLGTASWADNAVSASYALTASYVQNAQTASYVLNAVSSSFATTASYALNGGVTQIIAGTNVTISPVGGTGAVTINSSGGGGGGVTINNNTDGYLVTATGTADTLDGESNLRFSGSILNNKVRTNFSANNIVANTSHVFKGYSSADTFAYFLVQDFQGDDIIKVEGDISGGTNKVTIGDSSYAVYGTTIQVEDGLNKILLDGKVYATSIRVPDTALTNQGQFHAGATVADAWSSTGPTLTSGRVVYISGSGQWAAAMADSATTSTGVLGVVTNTANQNEVLLHGIIRVSQSLAGFTNGSPVYLATSSAGTITQTPPSTVGHVARYVGYVLDSGSRQIYFNPDFTWIEL